MSSPRILVAACAFLAVTVNQISADTPPETDEQRAEKPYTALIELQSTGPIGYLDPLFVSIRVTPLRAIDIEEIVVIPLGPLKHLYDRSLDTSSPERGRRCRFGANAGVEKRPFVATCELGDLGRVQDRLMNSAVFLPPSRQKLAIEIQVRQNGGVVSFYDETFVDLAPPRIGVVYGGFFGALLLAVFTALREYLDRPQRGRVGVVEWTRATVVGAAHGICRTIARSIVGGICALLVILLAQVTEGLEPPVSIHVQDFWGGVVVGLFSIPMSTWLAEKMKAGLAAQAVRAEARAVTEQAPEVTAAVSQ